MALAALLGAWTWRGHQLDAARADVARLTVERDRALADVQAQNAAVAALQDKAREQDDRATKAAQDAAQARRDADARVRKLLTAQVPTQCPEAVRWGAETGRALAERWR